MKIVFVFAICFAVFLAGIHADLQQFTPTEFARMRCSTDRDEQSITTWTGTALSFVAGERQKTLFNVVGVNLARCWPVGAGYQLVSRELQLYVNATTGAKLLTWANPWTSEVVPVVHVANDPVNFYFAGPTYPGNVDRDQVIFPSIQPLTYPNPLYGNATFAPYAPQALYQADEFFYFLTSLHQVTSEHHDSVKKLRLTWNRISQYLPWMKMGDRAGYLTFTASGYKVKKIADLPQILQDEINTRMPLYKKAPPCIIDRPNQSSWTYFKSNFEAYLAGVEFPIPAPNTPQPCKPE